MPLKEPQQTLGFFYLCKILKRLPPKPIEIGLTQTNGERNNFYFDTVILENDTFKGGRARLATSFMREIAMDSILKIEIQNGGKNYHSQE